LRSASWAFTLGVKDEIEKYFFNLPQVLLINAELYALVLILSNLGSQFATLGANVLAFINIPVSMF